MNKELIIKNSTVGVDIAMLEDKRLVELHQEKGNNQFSVGDIYLGKVRKLIPGLNAAFIDIGYSKDAFLHYTDMGPKIRSLLRVTTSATAGNLRDPLLKGFREQPEIVKTGKITEVLKNKQPILVQILKEPISTKGPRLSCEITIPGRFLVLSPFTNTVGISKKIESEDERKRLKILVESLKPKNFGVVVRTVAEGKGAAVLHEDLQHLVEKWKVLIRNLKGANPPAKVLSEISKTSTILRDLLNDNFNKIVTNNEATKIDLEKYIDQIAPERKGIVKIYNGKKPIYDHFGVTRQIKSSFGKTVSFAGGAYLVIEHTEALHVIDVNSGHKSSMSGDQESNAIRVNLEAADEIARQLRLRDIGGIIIVDFIDMKKIENKKLVFKRMKERMKMDRATHALLPLTKFNIMQITRSRVKPEVNISTVETCPSCGGTGKIEASVLLTDEIERKLNFILDENSSKRITMTVHPYIKAYLKKGFPSIFLRWCWKYKRMIELSENVNYSFTEFRFFDHHSEEEILI